MGQRSALSERAVENRTARRAAAYTLARKKCNGNRYGNGSVPWCRAFASFDWSSDFKRSEKHFIRSRFSMSDECGGIGVAFILVGIVEHACTQQPCAFWQNARLG